MYLDANFFIFANTFSDKRGVRARAMVQKIIAGTRAVTSVLALDEVMWVLIKNKQKAEVRDIIEEIYSLKNLEVREVPALVPLRALDFMEKYTLRPRDAFHVAIMEELGINEIVTDDADFDKVKTITRIPL